MVQYPQQRITLERNFTFDILTEFVERAKCTVRDQKTLTLLLVQAFLCFLKTIVPAKQECPLLCNLLMWLRAYPLNPAEKSTPILVCRGILLLNRSKAALFCA